MLRVLHSWDSGIVAIQTRGLAVDPVLGALYMSDNNVNYYIGKNWLPCGSLPTAPTNGGLGTCVSFMDQGSQCQFTCNNGYSLVGASTTCAGGSIVPQLCGRSCLPLVSMASGGVGTCT